MSYRVAIKLADSYSKEKKGYLASSRIRGHWLAENWSQADDFFYPEEFPQYQDDFFNPENQFKILKDYEVVIFNKTYEWRLAKMLKKNGQIVIVDFCDPDFLLSHSSEQRVADCLKTLQYADTAVVNGEAIKKELSKVYKGRIDIIPDRIDLESCKPQKLKHNKELKNIVWYGYSENLRVLEPYLKQIINMGLYITIISDKFFENLFLIGCKYDPKERINFKFWHPESINKRIIKCDVVFVGKDKNPYLSKFKSDNRAELGYALGMPVAWDINDLKSFKDYNIRVSDAKEGQYNVRRFKDIRHSVYEYDQIIKILLWERRQKCHL